MKQKTALITGITGQDGAYLAHLLTQKGYAVHGIIRRSSSPNVQRLETRESQHSQFGFGLLNIINLHYGDMTDAGGLTRIVSEVKPDEVYNLAAMSHVKISFENPEYTGDVDALGVIRLLEAIRQAGCRETKFYQASTSELFGGIYETACNETTPFYPKSPYGIAKLYGYWATVNYRESYNLFACNGILFNHESPLRGDIFVTRKITKAVAKIVKHIGTENCSVLKLGNLDAKRDWGHAADFVEGMYLMLQQDKPEDYVLATGENHSVREFVELAFQCVNITLRWEGKAENEKGYDAKTGQCFVAVDPAFYRPSEVAVLLGDPSKAKSKLGWRTKHSFQDLVQEMVQSDLQEQN